MSKKQDLVAILAEKFEMIVEGSVKAEDVKSTDDGNTLSLYNVGVMDLNPNRELVGRRVRFYVVNEGHPQEIKELNQTTNEMEGTGEFTTKEENAFWLNGETPKTILEMAAEAAVVVPSQVDNLITYLDTAFGQNNYTLHPTIDIGSNAKAAVVTIPVEGVPTKMIFGTVNGQLAGRKFSEQ